MTNKALTEQEVWDDSDLVASWNEAYQEYVKYHSLAAKGEKVDISTLRAETNTTNGNTVKQEQTTIEPVANPAEIDLGSDAEDQTTASARPTMARTHPPAPGAAIGAMPQALAATVQDEDMKNLMMSWYYAGYYTGLYEGKQQGYASAQKGG